MSPRIAADTDVVNSGPLKAFQDQISALERDYVRSKAENLPPGVNRMSLDAHIMQQIDMVVTALDMLFEGHRRLSVNDGDSVDRLGRVLADTDEVTTRLASQITGDGTSNRT